MMPLALAADPRPPIAAAAAVILLLVLLAPAPAAAGGDLPAYQPDATAPRAAVPEVYRWDLTPLFASDEAWAAAREELLRDLPALGRFAGTLDDPAALEACLQLYFDLHDRANYVTLYANLRQSTAEGDAAAAAMFQRGLAAMDELMAAAAFLRRELLTIPPPALEAAYAARPGLEAHRPYLSNLRRRAARLLSPDAERALGLLGDNLWAEIDLNELPSAYEDVFSALLTDIVWPAITDADGREVRLTLASYPRYRQSPDREVRRRAVEAVLGTVDSYRTTLAATLAGQVQLDVDLARARGYDSAVAAYLDKDDIALAVYDNLIGAVHDNLDLLHRYVDLRRRTMGLEKVHLYDLYVPLAADVAMEVPFAEARPILLEALAPLGPVYGAALAEGLDPRNGWLDLYPHQDKDSGAFSVSVHGAHPYVLMNYQDTYDDMSTLAHEYGHALHSHLAMRAQPYSSFRYAPFLAEIASTCNEMLLSDYLLARTDDPARRAALLVERLEAIRTTIFRQAMFAEFERTVHGFAEQGTPLTADLLESTYAGIVARYYGPHYELDQHDGMEWGYIPHFYYKYYVYSYATGLVSGIAIAERVRTEGAPAAEAFVEMLAAGASAPPLELLRRAGVDLTEPDALAAAMRTFERTLDEVEALLAPPPQPQG